MLKVWLTEDGHCTFLENQNMIFRSEKGLQHNNGYVSYIFLERYNVSYILEDLAKDFVKVSDEFSNLGIAEMFIRKEYLLQIVATL